ncbi:MAG: radical SAM protein [Desulfobacteraceae bacterium]|nr:MAG: radical SAM protein [Desulfobacteraceae bacterium]
MKILLISANTETINMPVLPLGLAFVNASLQNNGFETRMLNLLGEADARATIETVIQDFQPDAIGISVRNIDTQDIKNPGFMLDPVKTLIAWCREFSKSPIILGGAGYSIYPQAVLDYTQADMGIKGEGEIAFPELLRQLRMGMNPADFARLKVPGLYLPGIGKAENRQCIRKTSDITFPVPGVHFTVPDTINKDDLWVPFQTRRGCPMDCSYCSTGTIEGRLIRKLPIEKAMASLVAGAEAGFTQFFFVDNTFNLPPAYAMALCDRIIAAQLDIGWRCILYPSKISRELVAKMARAGCREVSLGFESGSDTLLRHFNKRFTTADVRKTSGLLAEYGIRQLGFLMLGGPGETKETVLESLTFADSLDLDALKITIGIRIYPDTRVAEIARQEGMIDSCDTLLTPAFYIRKELQDWLMQIIPAWIKDRPGWFF